MRRDVVHGTKKDYGLDVTNLYIYQWTQHIQYYVNHIIDKKSICGKLLRNLLEQTKLEISIGNLLLNKDY